MHGKSPIFVRTLSENHAVHFTNPVVQRTIIFGSGNGRALAANLPDR
jgi:hypothetical protein